MFQYEMESQPKDDCLQGTERHDYKIGLCLSLAHFNDTIKIFCKVT